MSARVFAYVLLVTAAAVVAGAVAVVFGSRPVDGEELAAFAAVALALQLYSLRMPGSGQIGVSAIATIACAFAVGVPFGMAIAAGAAIVQWIRSRGLFHRAVFDASQWVLATGAAGLVYTLFANGGVGSRMAAALVAGAAYAVVNQTLVCVAIGLSERMSPLAVWDERFRVGRFHYLANGPLALAWAALAATAGVLGIIAFAAVPVLVLLSLRPLVARLRATAVPAPSEAA